MHNESAQYLRSNELLSRGNSQLVVVDVQEKLIPHLFGASASTMIRNCWRLVKGAQLLGIPVAATEQYSQGLGPTVSELKELLGEIPEKLRFSSAEVLDWGPAAARTDDRFQVVICGIETHICVLQTAIDFIAQGYQVFVVADAVTSRREFDRNVALDRMAASGATILTTESVLFEWCEVAGTPEFKQISQLVREL